MAASKVKAQHILTASTYLAPFKFQNKALSGAGESASGLIMAKAARASAHPHDTTGSVVLAPDVRCRPAPYPAMAFHDLLGGISHCVTTR